MPPPQALAVLYTDRESVASMLSDIGVDLRLDDDGNQTIDARELSRMELYAANIATARVNGFCRAKYSVSEMARSWEVYDWATTIAARWLCGRRCNPVPEVISAFYEEVIESLKEVRAGVRQIAELAPSDEMWPVWSNIVVDHRYLLRKIRVQRRISERSNPQYSQNIARWAEYINEY